ncbi:hypothetical protein [Parasphingorhabdus sp.]|uniref:hypothetical protein n=1 Tax=Parasphingorhabdus sp. TaxID=2709688 RepID=UPI00300307E2
MTKRSPITAPSNHVRIAQAAGLKITPPAHIPLDETETLHFDSIIAEKANSEWTAHEIDIAALFAWSLHQLNEQTRLMTTEGTIVIVADGQSKVNPRLKAVSTLFNMVLAYRRTLGIHSVAKMPNAGDRARRNELSREMQDGFLGDDLIAKPDKPN